jgi:hypothetical protein
MDDLLTGYCNPPQLRKGPRISREAESNFIKNRGSVNNICFEDYGRNIKPELVNPRVTREGFSNCDQSRQGSVGSLFSNYGTMPLSAKPAPRIKFEGVHIQNDHRGSGVGKTLSSVPLSNRPSSATFFRPM